MTHLDATLESNFPTMTTRELREWLDEIEWNAQDAWSNQELTSLRSDRDKVRAELSRRAKRNQPQPPAAEDKAGGLRRDDDESPER
jgi:hypothetical protein